MSPTRFGSALCLVFLILASMVLTSEAGTIHSSLGTGDSKSSWKPGGKRAVAPECRHREAVFSILESVENEVRKVLNCEKMLSFEDGSFW